MLLFQDLQGKLEDLQTQGKPNGPVAVETLSNGGGGEEVPSAALLEAEKQVAVLERKLDELKNKNNVSCLVVLQPGGLVLFPLWA